MMKSELVGKCCDILIKTTLISMYLRETEVKDEKLAFMNTTVRAVALSAILMSTSIALTHKVCSTHSFITMLCTPISIGLMTNGLNYLAHRKKYFCSEMEIIEQTMEKGMDIIARILSVITLNLLAPYAKNNLSFFTLAVVVVSFDLSVSCRRKLFYSHPVE